MGMGTLGAEETVGTSTELEVGRSEGSAGSGSSTEVGVSHKRDTTEGSRLDQRMLFSSKTDVILVGTSFLSLVRLMDVDDDVGMCLCCG